MGRWAPGAAARLADAAFELFARDGFSAVTVEQIATTAGVTERTFFRHFPTKEDVVFADGNDIIADLIGAIRATPPTATPREILFAAMTRLAQRFQLDREHLRVRAAVIATEAALQERELYKRQQISAALIDELVGRGLPAQRAAMLSGTGLVVFQTVYAGWLSDRSRVSLSARLEGALTNLAADLGT
jgi:AcrR family transcriptional regulator